MDEYWRLGFDVSHSSEPPLQMHNSNEVNPQNKRDLKMTTDTK
jgi:hypothetical protein